MDGTSNYYGIFCDSGHKAALGIQFHITNVWMDTRPTPDEFKEVLRKAREMLAKDELWDNILEEMYQNDREERFCYAARKVRGYKIPCPKCGAENEIVWPRITFAQKDTGRGWDGSYKCDFCGVAMSEYDWKKNFDKATFPEEETPREESRKKMVVDPECFLKPWQEMKEKFPVCVKKNCKCSALEEWKDKTMCNGVFG